MADTAQVLGWNIVCTGNISLVRIGSPDYAIHLNQLLAGYVELKALDDGSITLTNISNG